VFAHPFDEADDGLIDIDGATRCGWVAREWRDGCLHGHQLVA
jgi:hypothetical protein